MEINQKKYFFDRFPSFFDYSDCLCNLSMLVEKSFSIRLVYEDNIL